ncbi:MAG: prenyltransferase [Alphaproteobacteria bacterium]|nr:prenyltransferase [Alphaproteobacteria bacterium]
MAFARHGLIAEGFFNGAVARILELQRPDGAIPWFDNGVWDPWNHTESAMGLLLAGRREEADACFAYLRQTQEKDGSWWAEYGSAVSLETGRYEGSGDEPKRRDTNFIAYPAVGLWHHFVCTKDKSFLQDHWPMVRRAIAFVLTLQSPEGEIRWCAPDPATPEDDALVTGNASIYKSLDCAIAIAEMLNEDTQAWRQALARLGQALRQKPHRFDRTWEKKDYFSMDWYYPVLAGAVRGAQARRRLSQRWNEFIAKGKGCRCVTGQPWVTVAESCELTLALLAVGEAAAARDLFSWQHQWRAEDGSYWMGWQFEMNRPWPEERPAWTAAAAILAADALEQATPACGLFTRASAFDTLQDP